MLLAGDTRRTDKRRLPRAKPPSLKRCGCSPSSAVLRPSLSGAPVWQRRGSGRTNLGVTAVLRSGRPSGRRAGRRCWHTFRGAVWCKSTRIDGPSHKRAGQTVGLAGIEPATSALSVLRSNRLSYSPRRLRSYTSSSRHELLSPKESHRHRLPATEPHPHIVPQRITISDRSLLSRRQT
jgi:hypothetical protein